MALALGALPAATAFPWFSIPSFFKRSDTSSWTPPKPTHRAEGNIELKKSPQPTSAPRRYELERRLAGFTMGGSTCGYVASEWSEFFLFFSPFSFLVSILRLMALLGTPVGLIEFPLFKMTPLPASELARLAPTMGPTSGAVIPPLPPAPSSRQHAFTTRHQRQACATHRQTSIPSAGKSPPLLARLISVSNKGTSSTSLYPSCHTYIFSTTASPGRTFSLFNCDVSTGIGTLLDYPPEFTRSLSSSSSKSVTTTSSSRTTSSESTTTTSSSTPTPTQDPGAGSGGGSNVGAIAGGTVGGLAVLGAAGLLIFFFFLRKGKSDKDPVSPPPPQPQVPPPGSISTTPGMTQSVYSTAPPGVYPNSPGGFQQPPPHFSPPASVYDPNYGQYNQQGQGQGFGQYPPGQQPYPPQQGYPPQGYPPPQGYGQYDPSQHTSYNPSNPSNSPPPQSSPTTVMAGTPPVGDPNTSPVKPLEGYHHQQHYPTELATVNPVGMSNNRAELG